MTELNRKTIDQVRAYAEELGYRIVWEHDLLEVCGQISLLLEGYGEEFEVYFKPNPKTGYLRWDYAGLKHDYSSTRISAWKGPEGLQKTLKDFQEFGVGQGLKPYDGKEED
jgi:hypothetical protein